MSIINLTISSRKTFRAFWILAHLITASITAIAILFAVHALTWPNFAIALALVLVTRSIGPHMKWRAVEN